MFRVSRALAASFSPAAATAGEGSPPAPAPSSSLGDAAARSARSSFLVSADMAHALHPNYSDRHEPDHKPLFGKGLVIKHNANQRYATDALSAALFREVGARSAAFGPIPSQEFCVRSDMGCGSTIGPILSSGLGVRTVDVGAPQLSMHSIREMCAVEDVSFLKTFFFFFSGFFSFFDFGLFLLFVLFAQPNKNFKTLSLSLIPRSATPTPTSAPSSRTSRPWQRPSTRTRSTLPGRRASWTRSRASSASRKKERVFFPHFYFNKFFFFLQ